MGGGLMQLVAYGAQDIYLTGNAQITFFKVVYRRHTNFAMEAIEQTYNGNPDFGKKVSTTISRNGDLIYHTYVQISLPSVSIPAGGRFRWLNSLGHILLKSIQIEIGGQQIDKHYGDWLHIWSELSQKAGHKNGYDKMIGNVPVLTSMYDNPTASLNSLIVPAYTLYVPLEFWFCRNPGLALPLIALQYHEVKINIEFTDAKSCYYYSTGGSATPATLPGLGSLGATMYVDYIYLDTEERRRFAQVSHEYLLEKLQYTGEESVSGIQQKLKLNFNHPTKELIWVVQLDKVTDQSAVGPYGGAQWFNYTDDFDSTYKNLETFPYISIHGQPNTSVGATEIVSLVPYEQAGANPVSVAKLQLNGHDRFSERSGDYFNWVQPYQHHENVPAVGINVYSFALKPEEHQPSGSCNFSRIDNATLQMMLSNAYKTAGTTGEFRIYAVNYNVLRIMSGMGGLADSN